LPAFDLTVMSTGSVQLSVTNTLPNTYQWGTLLVGNRVYIDRGYTFTDIPTSFQGLKYLMTANDDKAVTSPTAVSFDVNLAVTVLVAYDDRTSGLPAWLQSWSDTGNEWVNTDSTLHVYRMDFPAGTVTLGGNSPAQSMYSVAVMAKGPLSIEGSPTTSITQGLGYSFIPSTSGGVGLTFSIANQPTWAIFDSVSGALTGTPGIGDVGTTTANIVISVSDGQQTASLPAFDITVLASAAGSANLSWVAPTQNTDGTDLGVGDLAGFNVYYGPAVNDYPNVVTIDNPTVTTFLVENLSPGTWVFVITAFNSSGNESDYSDYASKTVAP